MLGLTGVLSAVALDLVTEEIACAVELGGSQATVGLAHVWLHVHYEAILYLLQK